MDDTAATPEPDERPEPRPVIDDPAPVGRHATPVPPEDATAADVSTSDVATPDDPAAEAPTADVLAAEDPAAGETPAGETPAGETPAGETTTRSTRLVTRRRTLLGAAIVLVGGGVGAVVGAVRKRPTAARPRPAVPPAVLVDALAAERRLIAGLSASARDSALRPIAVQLIADHQAHAHALAATLSPYPGAADQVTAPASPKHSRAELRAAEQQASAAAAGRAAELSGSVSALLASVAACEAAHAELLS
jgi:hypothetical protein